MTWACNQYGTTWLDGVAKSLVSPYYLQGCGSNVGVAPAPPQELWNVPPVSGESAQATVNSLLNEQMVNQQTINASQVTSSWWDTLLGDTSSEIDNIPSMLKVGLIGIVGMGLFMMLGDSGPRRYGR